MNKLGVKDLEPVRVVGGAMATIVFAASVVKQVADTYDEATGWLGLAFAVVIAIGTKLQRDRVTPVAKLEATLTSRQGNSIHPNDPKNGFGDPDPNVGGALAD